MLGVGTRAKPLSRYLDGCFHSQNPVFAARFAVFANLGKTMTFDLLAALPAIAPKAIEWAEDHSSAIAQFGQPLNAALLSVARSVGVLHPERVRVTEVASLPLPEDADLRKVAVGTGLLGPGMVGLTLGYGVYVCRGYDTIRLLSHEFRHVHQYEQAGSIAAFLSVYLHQIATVGYRNSPLEIDARAHEKHHA